MKHTDGAPDHPRDKTPGERKFYPPPPPRPPQGPARLDYRDKQERQPYPNPRYRPPRRGDSTDFPLGLLLYVITFFMFIAWESSSAIATGRLLMRLLAMDIAALALATALGAATRRWGITAGVTTGALVGLGGCGLLLSNCGHGGF